MKQYFIGFGLILSSLLIGVIAFFYLALSPQLDAKGVLVEVALSENLTPNQDFRVFTGQSLYYTLSAKDENDKEQILLMSEEGKTVHIQAIDEGWSAEKIQTKVEEEGHSVDRLTLGYYDDQLVWEVKSQATYYLYDFKTGDLIRQL